MNYRDVKPHRLELPAAGRGVLAAALLLSLFPGLTGAAAPAASEPSRPCIVNIYNFIRQNDYRLPNSEATLLEATTRQIELLHQAGLPATFAFEYDALIDTNYQRLFLQGPGTNFEIGAWWEIPQKLVEKAGLTWRGHHEWDPAANVGFSPGYTPDERRKLVDVYMADFKAIFGYYPRSVGSWFIDEVTLAYLVERYGIVASCNCKDQVGTDGYTLWGGYWNQAYYPSRLNAYMPAQSKAGQIEVPVFRMLGSDPIYQHGTTPGLFSLEPVYRESGGSEKWVEWLMNNLMRQPSLAFAYTQAGQENSFGWDGMKRGLTHQVALFATLAKAGKIQLQTLAQTGQWFKQRYPLTPPAAMAALDDWKNEGRKTVWYNSRFYRLNLLWEHDAFLIRDLHCFDERVVSPTHTTALTTSSLAYETLPIMDWALWHSGLKSAGMWPVLLAEDGQTSPLRPEGQPILKGFDENSLSLEQPLQGGGSFTILCREAGLTCAALDKQRQPLRWAWHLVGGARQDGIVKNVGADRIDYHYAGADYQLRLVPNSGACLRAADGSLRLTANNQGILGFTFGTAALPAAEKATGGAPLRR